jgi:hypothetical protein
MEDISPRCEFGLFGFMLDPGAYICFLIVRDCMMTAMQFQRFQTILRAPLHGAR